MKKISTFLTSIMLAAFSFVAFAQVSINTTTAWWYYEDFESYTADYEVFRNATDGWDNLTNQVRILYRTDATNASAIGNVYAFGGGAKLEFSETSSANGGGPANNSKTFANKLAGFVYINTSFYSSTGGSGYIFKDDAGNEVFRFEGRNHNANDGAVQFTGKTYADILLARRGQWTDIECILDLTTNKIVKITLKNNQLANTESTFTNIDLTGLNAAHNGNVQTLQITSANYTTGGLDNTTIGQMVIDNLINLAGDAELQSLETTTVDKTYTVDACTYAMDMYVVMNAGTTTDIVWSVSDWGGLSAADQAKVSLTRSTTDYASAVLTTTDAVSADATITIKAEFNGIEQTKQVTLKAVNISAMKTGLLNVIAAATTSNDGVGTGINDYLDGLKTTLSTAISTAQNVHDTSSDPLAIQQAIENLQAAETAFTDALTPFNNFIGYILEVQAIHDSEGRDYIAFFAAIKATLQTAIDAATTAAGTVEAKGTVTSVEDMEAATATLSAALETYNNAIPSYTSLDAAVATAEAKYNSANARVGAKFLNYAQSDVDEFYAAVETANEILSEATTTTALNDAKTAVEAAVNLLGTKRNKPGSDTTYKIYSYGESSGNTPNTKKIMYVDESGETAALKPMAADDIDENTAIADEWKIVETATSQYTIQNTATNLYLKVVGLSEDAVTLTLPETTAGGSKIASVDAGYFFYGIVQGSAYLRQRNNSNTDLNDGIPAYVSYNSDLGRFDTSFQFEETSGTVQIKDASSSATVVSESYYDLTGKATQPTAKGLLIKKTTYSDGKVVVEKMIK